MQPPLANTDNFKEKSAAVWGASPAGTTSAPHLQPGTQEYFELSLKKRVEHEMPWLFDVIPFKECTGKKVLEIGCGAGYDAYEFCKNNADYTGIDITPQNIDRTKTHLAFYNFSPKVMLGDAENLQFENANFDVAFSNGVLHHTPDIAKAFSEIYRVLNPGGKFYVLVYYKHSIFYWGYLWLYEHLWLKGYKKRTLQERLAMIEYTTSTDKPLVNVYSKQELQTLLKTAGFKIEKTYIRKLTKEDLPPLNLPGIGDVWRFIPQKILDAASKLWGWYLIIHATK